MDDRVLDSILKDNGFVNQPELRSQWWPADRRFMREEELKLMNELRARIGKPPA
ncbi:MAG: hypothetical protein IPK83_00115 [Planctomycetes bacterium]|nr:hypothetical protein [Planctomycetota bacterium]